MGAVLVPHLLEKDYYVTVLDLMIYGEEVLKKNPDLRIIKGDIRDQTLLEREIPNHEKWNSPQKKSYDQKGF